MLCKIVFSFHFIPPLFGCRGPFALILFFYWTGSIYPHQLLLKLLLLALLLLLLQLHCSIIERRSCDGSIMKSLWCFLVSLLNLLTSIHWALDITSLFEIILLCRKSDTIAAGLLLLLLYIGRGKSREGRAKVLRRLLLLLVGSCRRRLEQGIYLVYIICDRGSTELWTCRFQSYSTLWSLCLRRRLMELIYKGRLILLLISYVHPRLLVNIDLRILNRWLWARLSAIEISHVFLCCSWYYRSRPNSLTWWFDSRSGLYHRILVLLMRRHLNYGLGDDLSLCRWSTYSRARSDNQFWGTSQLLREVTWILGNQLRSALKWMSDGLGEGLELGKGCLMSWGLGRL